METQTIALNVKSGLLAEARKLADDEGVSLDHLITAAIAEKLSALRTESFFRERAAGADIPRALELLNKAGGANAPDPEDAP